MISTRFRSPIFRSLPHRKAFSLAGPMILSNITVPLMGVADTAMLGHLDSPVYLGAAAIGANILALLFWMFSFLRMGTTSVVGRSLGAEDTFSAKKYLFSSLYLGIGLGLLLILGQWILIPIAVELIAPNSELGSLALEYCHVRIYSAPAVLMTYVIIGWFIALQNARIPLVITVAANSVNILLDYIFIVEMNMASYGAALASLIAEYTAMCIGLFFVLRTLKVLKWPTLNIKDIFQLNDWKMMFGLNSDLFVRTTVLLFVFNFFTAQGALFGETTLAANTLIMQLVLVMSFGLDGYAHAAETLAARANGARDTLTFYRSCLTCLIPALAISIVFTLLFYFGDNILISLLSDIDSVQTAAKEYITWLYFLPIVSVWCYLLDGIFIGVGKTRLLRNWMLVAVSLVFLPLWWFFGRETNHFLWLAFLFFNLFRSLSLSLSFILISSNCRWH